MARLEKLVHVRHMRTCHCEQGAEILGPGHAPADDTQRGSAASLYGAIPVGDAMSRGLL